MKSVVFFVNDLNSGGIENYLLRFLNYFDGKIKPTVVCKSGNFGELEEQYVKIKNIDLVMLKIGYIDPAKIIELYGFLKARNFDTVVDFTGNFAAFPLLVAKLVGINNRIAFYRGASNHFEKSKLKNIYNSFINRLVNQNATSILSNSKAALKFFFKNSDDQRFQVIYNGIDADKFFNSKFKDLRVDLEIPSGAFVISHVGRFAEAKNHKAIIETAISLCVTNKNVCFILCGKGVDSQFKDLITKEKLNTQIKLLGYRNDVISILKSWKFFLQLIIHFSNRLFFLKEYHFLK